MSNRRIILWLFIATILLTAANVLLTWRVPTKSVAIRSNLLDPLFDPSTIIIERSETPRTVLRKSEGKWRIVEPYSSTVDIAHVLRLLDVFSFATAEDALTETELIRLGRNRSDFGLSDSRLRISFLNARDSASFEFGYLTPMSNCVYVARSDETPVLVVPVELFVAANRDAEAFRERAVFPYTSDFVTGFDLKTSDSARLSFSRDGENWLIDGRPASASRVKDFLTCLSTARAVDFVWPVGATNETPIASAALLSGYGLDGDSALALTLHCRDGRDRRILLGHECGSDRTYASVQGGGAIVTIPASVKSAALQGAPVFSDTRLFPLAETDVSSFVISDGSVSYVLAREGRDGWRLDAPLAAPADAQVTDGILGRLMSLTSADLASTGLKVSVSTNLPSYVVSARSVLGKERLDDLRSREILKIDPALVRRLVASSGADRGASSVSIVRQGDRRQWTIETESYSEWSVREESVGAILEALKSLSSVRIEELTPSASDLSRFGLDVPSYTLAVDQEKIGAVRRNILIGAPTKGGRYATVGSSDAVFVIPERTISILTAPLVQNKR